MTIAEEVMEVCVWWWGVLVSLELKVSGGGDGAGDGSG